MIIVPRGTHSDGPYRKASEGDRVIIPRIGFTPFTVAGQPTGAAGRVGFCSDGDVGDPTGCCHDGSIWRKFPLGTEINPTRGIQLFVISNDDKFHALSGDPLEEDFQVQRPPGAAGGAASWPAVFTPDGVNIWIGGPYNGTPALANTFWFSDDGGATWTNKYDKHPDAEDATVYSIWGVDGELWACSNTAFGNSRIVKYNSGTGNWDSQYDFGAQTNPNCVWGRSATDMYCISVSTTLTLLQDTGGGWAAETIQAGCYYTVASADAPPTQICMAGDATHLYVLNSSYLGLRMFRGTFNGTDWAQETVSWDANFRVGDIGWGRNVGVDETGAIWVGGYSNTTAHVEVHRRDPTTGNWAQSLDAYYSGIGGPGNIIAVSSTNVIVYGTNLIGVFDGTSWTVYDPRTDIAGFSDTTRLWGGWAVEL